jgi:hypothetical protein
VCCAADLEQQLDAKGLTKHAQQSVTCSTGLALSMLHMVLPVSAQFCLVVQLMGSSCSVNGGNLYNRSRATAIYSMPVSIALSQPPCAIC